MSKNKKKNAKNAPQSKPEKRPNYTTIIIFAVIIVAVLLVSNLFRSQKTEASSLDPSKTYFAEIVIQDYGTITVKLDQKSAPRTCENFVELAERGFYDGLTFHRIIEGFMMQGGAPNSEKLEPSAIVGEFSENGYANPLKHERGVISMARTNDMNSASSQFFIMHQTKTHLDGKYAAFGKVVEGIEVVDAICESSEPTDNNGSIPKANQPVITSITIRIE